MATIITKDNFDSIVNSQKTVLIDFWAAWCGPCKMLAPIIDEIANETDDSVVVGKVNVDDEPSLAQKFGIMSIPTLLVFKNGELVNKTVGVRSKQDILNIILYN